MNRLGLQLFRGKIRRRPLPALLGLTLDYLTYVGMVLFWIVLVASKWPLAWLDRRLRRPLRPRLIDWLAKRVHG